MNPIDTLLSQAMHLLADGHNTIFLGQNVAYDGNVVFRHLDGIAMEKRLELPVAEEMQLGMSIGLALQGFLPVSIYPRCDFLLRAADQLVNHLDKLPQLSRGQWLPKVIIRTRVGSTKPLNAGPQHTQNHAEAFRNMFHWIVLEEITQPGQILPAYSRALERDEATLLIEAIGG